MLLTHLGHACLLLDVDGTRLLIDPGVYSTGLDDLRGLAAIAVTHQHPDHLDQARLSALVAENPKAVVLAEPQAATLIEEQAGVSAHALEADHTIGAGPIELTAVGDQHAFNHDDVPACGNRGLVVTAEDQPRLFHPGDAYDVSPGAVDVLALPLNAPWAAVRDTLAFVRRVAPRTVVPIHDGLLSEDGRASYLMHVNRFGPQRTTVRDLRGAGPATF